MYEFKNELRKLKELTDVLVSNGYLTDQASQWEAALDAIPEIIFIVNPDFDIKFVNKKFAEKMCVEKNSLINRKCFHIITCCDEKGTCLCEENQSEPVYLGDIEITNGLIGWFSYTRSPIYNDENELTYQFKVNIPNKALDGFIKHWSKGMFNCENVLCEDCRYCDKWYKKITIGE